MRTDTPFVNMQTKVLFRAVVDAGGDFKAAKLLRKYAAPLITASGRHLPVDPETIRCLRRGVIKSEYVAIYTSALRQAVRLDAAKRQKGRRRRQGVG